MTKDNNYTHMLLMRKKVLTLLREVQFNDLKQKKKRQSNCVLKNNTKFDCMKTPFSISYSTYHILRLT